MHVPPLAGWKGGLRLGLAILMFAMINNLVEGPAQAQGGDGQCAPTVARIYNVVHQSALWCAVTVCVVIAPEYVGATTWLCFQRLLGNIAGGWLACGLVIGVRNGIGLSFVSFFVVLVTFVTQISDLTRFGGFFAVTYVIVSFQGFFMGNRDVIILAGTRVLAISIGVLTALVLSCVVFPISASGNAVLLTKDALEATLELNRLAWRGLVLEIEKEYGSGSDDSSKGGGHGMHGDTVVEMARSQSDDKGSFHDEGDKEPADSLRLRLARVLGRLKGKAQAAIQGTEEPQWDDQVSRTYVGYAKYLEAMFNARNEIYVGKLFGTRWFAPSVKWVSSRHWHMPLMQMWAVRVALREVRRAVFGIQQFIVDGFGDDIMEALQKAMPPEVLSSLKTQSTAALECMCAVFPEQSIKTVGWASAKEIERYIESAETLLAMSTSLHRGSPSSSGDNESPDEKLDGDDENGFSEGHDCVSRDTGSSRWHPLTPAANSTSSRDDVMGLPSPVDGRRQWGVCRTAAPGRGIQQELHCGRSSSSSRRSDLVVERGGIARGSTFHRENVGPVNMGPSSEGLGHPSSTGAAQPGMSSNPSSGSLMMDAHAAQQNRSGASPVAGTRLATATSAQSDSTDRQHYSDHTLRYHSHRQLRRSSTQEENQEKWQQWGRQVSMRDPRAAETLSHERRDPSGDCTPHSHVSHVTLESCMRPNSRDGNNSWMLDSGSTAPLDTSSWHRPRHRSLDLQSDSDRQASQQLPWSSAHTLAVPSRHVSGDGATTASRGHRGRGGSWRGEVAAAAAESRTVPSSPHAKAAAWHQQALNETLSEEENKLQSSKQSYSHVHTPPSLAIRDEAPASRKQSSSRRRSSRGALGEAAKTSEGGGITQLHFPDTLTGYVSQVRWNGFNVLLVTLGGALARLHTCINELLPLLPGSDLDAKDAPPPIQLERWGRVDVTLQELRPFLRSAQPGVGAGQAEGTVFEKPGGDGENY